MALANLARRPSRPVPPAPPGTAVALGSRIVLCPLQLPACSRPEKTRAQAQHTTRKEAAGDADERRTQWVLRKGARKRAGMSGARRGAQDREKPRGLSSVRPRGPRLRPQPGVLCAGPAAGGAASSYRGGPVAAVRGRPGRDRSGC
jgi:hypothetical protein